MHECIGCQPIDTELSQFHTALSELQDEREASRTAQVVLVTTGPR
jgi:hypothetical protein